MGSHVPTLRELIWLSVSNIVMPTHTRYTGGKIKHAVTITYSHFLVLILLVMPDEMNSLTLRGLWHLGKHCVWMKSTLNTLVLWLKWAKNRCLFIFVLSSPQVLNVFPCLFGENNCLLTLGHARPVYYYWTADKLWSFLMVRNTSCVYSKKGKGYSKKENMESVHFSLDILKLLLWCLLPPFCFMRKKLRLYALNSDRLELQHTPPLTKYLALDKCLHVCNWELLTCV